MPVDQLTIEQLRIEQIAKVLQAADPTPTPEPTDKCANHCIHPDPGTAGHHDSRQPLY